MISGKDWNCDKCGRKKLESMFKLWVNNKEYGVCYSCKFPNEEYTPIPYEELEEEKEGEE